MNIYKDPLCFHHSSLWLQNELTEEYDIRLSQQMNQDLVLLNSLVLDAMQEINFMQVTYETNSNSWFASIAYFTVNGNGFFPQ